MNTYGNTGNEGQRGDDDGNNFNTHGVQNNEPSRHHGRDDDSSSTHPNQGGGGSNANGSYDRNGGYGRGQGSGGRSNEPSRHSGDYDPNTYGFSVNEPSRHRDIDISVHPGNRSSVPMKANLDWTEDTLHSECASRCGMHPKQCYSTHNGTPISGSGKVHQTAIRHRSMITLNARLRGG